MKKLAIIPAYNEGFNLSRVVQDVELNAPDFDYLIINDGSSDNTREVCIKYNLNTLHLPVNLGIGGAVQAGYQYARDYGYDIAVQFDGDCQHEARYLDDMVRKLVDDKLDMVIGSRFIENKGFQSTIIRQVGIRYFNALIRLITGQVITDPTSGMRMIGRDLIREFAKDYPKDYPEPESVTYALLKNKKIAEIPVTMKEREGGVSSISPINAVYYMIKVTMAILIVALRKPSRGD